MRAPRRWSGAMSATRVPTDVVHPDQPKPWNVRRNSATITEAVQT